MDHAEFGIRGMRCGKCEAKVRAALLSVPGVDEVDVSHRSESAVVRGTGDIEFDAIRAAIVSAGDYNVLSDIAMNARVSSDDASSDESLYPLFLIVGFVAGVTILVAASTGAWLIEPITRHFMAGFFITFAFFKLLDLPGFVAAFRGYDLVARRMPVWGWAYPFVELALGAAYLLAWAPMTTNLVTLVLMLVGAVGVAKALIDKRTIRCACLGAVLNLPMTKVTLVENMSMAAMAIGMIVVHC